MKDRLLTFLKKENISATNLADEIGVQRSSISHILSGRNNPSYDFIFKMINRYEYMNAEWLITGKGNMYKTEQKKIDENADKDKGIFDNEIRDSAASEQSDQVKNDRKKFTEETHKNDYEKKVTNVNKIEKIVYFYKNGTFREYNPSE